MRLQTLEWYIQYVYSGDDYGVEAQRWGQVANITWEILLQPAPGHQPSYATEIYNPRLGPTPRSKFCKIYKRFSCVLVGSTTATKPLCISLKAHKPRVINCKRWASSLKNLNTISLRWLNPLVYNGPQLIVRCNWKKFDEGARKVLLETFCDTTVSKQSCDWVHPSTPRKRVPCTWYSCSKHWTCFWMLCHWNPSRHVVSARRRQLFTWCCRTYRPDQRLEQRSRWSSRVASTITKFDSVGLLPVGSYGKSDFRDPLSAQHIEEIPDVMKWGYQNIIRR